MRIALKILAHLAALAALYAVFSTALALGLQVDALYGGLGLAGTAILTGLYIWLGFIRRRS